MDQSARTKDRDCCFHIHINAYNLFPTFRFVSSKQVYGILQEYDCFRGILEISRENARGAHKCQQRDGMELNAGELSKPMDGTYS